MHTTACRFHLSLAWLPRDEPHAGYTRTCLPELVFVTTSAATSPQLDTPRSLTLGQTSRHTLDSQHAPSTPALARVCTMHVYPLFFGSKR